jgi:DNA-binding transcriptional LysR family regulator
VASPAWLQQLPAPITHPRALAGLPCITLGYGDFQNQLRWEPLPQAKAPSAAPAPPSAAGNTPDREPCADHAPLELTVHTPITVASSTGIVTLALQHQGWALPPTLRQNRHLQKAVWCSCFPTGNWAAAIRNARPTPCIPTRHLPLKVRALIDHLVQAAA